MTKRHFQALAEALGKIKPAAPDGVGPLSDVAMAHRQAVREWGQAVSAVADVCADSNGRFDRRRFLAACDAEPGL